MDENLPTVNLFRTASQIPAMTSLSDDFASTRKHVFIVFLHGAGKWVFRRAKSPIRFGACDADPEHVLQPTDAHGGDADHMHKSNKVRGGIGLHAADDIGEMYGCGIASDERITGSDPMIRF